MEKLQDRTYTEKYIYFTALHNLVNMLNNNSTEKEFEDYFNQCLLKFYGSMCDPRIVDDKSFITYKEMFLNISSIYNNDMSLTF